MDTKYCSKCAYMRLISSFLKNASTALNSKVFTIYITYREIQNRSNRKRKALCQLSSENPPILPETLIHTNNPCIETPIPAETLIQALV